MWYRLEIIFQSLNEKPHQIGLYNFLRPYKRGS